MATFAWIIFSLSGLGIVVVVLSRVPKVMTRPPARVRLMVAADNLLGYFWFKIKQMIGWLWHFVLEAKDIRPSSQGIITQVGKVKNVFKIRIKQNEKDPDWMPEVAHQTVVEQDEPEQGAKPAHKTAEDLYLETIRKDPNNRQAYEGLGRLYLQEKNYADAVEIFRWLTKTEPRRDVYWSNLGISLYSTRDYPGAISSYEQALKLNNKVPARWVNLALCFESVEEHTKAIRAINRALDLDPRNINYLMLLADIYIRVENKVRSEEVLTQVLSIEPTNKLAREKLMKLRI